MLGAFKWSGKSEEKKIFSNVEDSRASSYSLSLTHLARKIRELKGGGEKIGFTKHSFENKAKASG